ncbi:hypothetical protein [Streptomyces sp. NPDC095602]|uniref:hypothetical protein n=1 Tax=Streptomyces sp. NPDC095602 TaxID=3155819 RepID=UPI00332AA0D4
MTRPPASSATPRAAGHPGGGGAASAMRRVLALDAVGMAVVGVAYLAAAAPLGRLLGPGTFTVAAVGAAMLVLGAGTAVVARLDPPPAAAVRGVIACGALWIALSLAALAFGWLDLSTAGVVWTWLQIAPVAVFASWQTLTLRKCRPTGTSE